MNDDVIKLATLHVTNSSVAIGQYLRCLRNKISTCSISLASAVVLDLALRALRFVTLSLDLDCFSSWVTA